MRYERCVERSKTLEMWLRDAGPAPDTRPAGGGCEAKPAFVVTGWQLGLADRFYFPMYLPSRKTRKVIIDSPLGAGEVAQ